MIPIDINKPVPGFYKTRLVKGGPFVPARIYRLCCCTVNGGSGNDEHIWDETCDRFPPLRAEVDGRERHPLDIWSRVAKWPITENEFRYMSDTRAWAADYAPATPEANPMKAVDINDVPPLF